MISDDERREIAKMLRDATEGHGDVPGIPDSEVFCILEIGTGFADGFADKTDVEALADLIDRPTCRNVAECRDIDFACSECGYEQASAYGFGYCPDCGREVV